MNTVQIKLHGSPLRLAVPGGGFAIGSVGDHNAVRLVFERPEEHAGDNLRLYLAQDEEGFRLVELGASDEFPLPDIFTRGTALRLQAAFDRNGSIVAHSDVAVFYLRESIANAGQEGLPTLNEISERLARVVEGIKAIDGLSAAVTRLNAELDISRRVADGVYPGRDLNELFAGDIAAAPFNGDAWGWIQARARAADWQGIHIGDYISFTTLPGSYTAGDGTVAQKAEGYSLKAEIAGIDTYYGYGVPACGHHIDFICRTCWPDRHVFNRAGYNNGTSLSPIPWAASDLKAFLNSQEAQVPNAETANPDLVAVDYRTSGVLDKFPEELKAAIAPKLVIAPQRYSAASLLNNDNSWSWTELGKLWVPFEAEVFGATHNGGFNRFSGGGFAQYRLFASNRSRTVKSSAESGGGVNWWTATSAAGNSLNIAHVGNAGHANLNTAAYGQVYVPVCFRIA